jgi:hypothetical protein
MYKLNKITKIMGATFVLATSSAAMAQQTASADATVNVLNAFTFTKVTDLSFGTIRATNDSINVASLNLLGTDVSTGSSDNLAAVVELIPGSSATFTIAGVTAFTPMTVTFPTADTPVTPDSGAPGLAEFIIPGDIDDDGTFSNGGWSMAVAGVLVVPATTTTALVTSDTNGDAAFSVGAQLVTVASANAFNDEGYTGSFTLTVDY